MSHLKGLEADPEAKDKFPGFHTLSVPGVSTYPWPLTISFSCLSLVESQRASSLSPDLGEAKPCLADMPDIFLHVHDVHVSNVLSFC